MKRRGSVAAALLLICRKREDSMTRFRVAVLAVAAVSVVSLVGLAPAQADHTPVPGVVTLVGSLQSELGCPGDWQPECAQTRLQPVAGSPGVFQGTFDVPAGSYEYKVALNGSWEENYGAGGPPAEPTWRSRRPVGRLPSPTTTART